MSIQWPREKRKAMGFPGREQEEHFALLFKDLPADWIATVDRLSSEIIEQECDHDGLIQSLNSSFNLEDLKHIPECDELILSWICSKALAEEPTLDTWRKVRHLKNNSVYLERWLVVAMLAYVQKHSSVKDDYTALATKAIISLDSLSLESEYSRINDDRKQHYILWQNNQDKLTSLWQGLQWRSSDVFTGEHTFIELLQYLCPSELAQTTSQLKNPHLIDTILWFVMDSFELWSTFAISAPEAFRADGTWTKQNLMPMLLEKASSAISGASSLLSHAPSKEETNSVRAEIKGLADAVISTLSKRKDFGPLIGRWATWLSRQLLMQGFRETENIRSSAVVHMALLDAIGEQINAGDVFSEKSPEDAKHWEAWCRRICLSYLAHNDYTTAPEFSSYLEEWMIETDGWSGAKAKKLRENVSFLSIASCKLIPGDAASYLAYSAIATSSDPFEQWVSLWGSLFHLREIVEFGDPDSHKAEKYNAQSDGRMSVA
jgi:hypothetical protein